MTKNVFSLFPELGKLADVSNYNNGASRKSGVLPSQEIYEFIREGRILSEVQITEDQIQPATIDLRFGSTAYQVKASFVPGRRFTVLNKMQKSIIREINLTEFAVFQKGEVYIVPLMESLHLPRGISAKANPQEHYRTARYIQTIDY